MRWQTDVQASATPGLSKWAGPEPANRHLRHHAPPPYVGQIHNKYRGERTTHELSSSELKCEAQDERNKGCWEAALKNIPMRHEGKKRQLFINNRLLSTYS